MEKYRYIHTPKSLGSLTAVQWTGKNLAEIERVFNGLAMFSAKYGRLLVIDGIHRLEVLQGNYLIHLDQPQGGRHFFEANEKFFIGEHTPLPEVQAEPLKVLPPNPSPVVPKEGRKARYEKALLEVLDYEKDYPRFKPNEETSEPYGCLIVPNGENVTVIVGGYAFPKVGKVITESNGYGTVVTVKMTGVYGHKNTEEPED